MAAVTPRVCIMLLATTVGAAMVAQVEHRPSPADHEARLKDIANLGEPRKRCAGLLLCPCPASCVRRELHQPQHCHPQTRCSVVQG